MTKMFSTAEGNVNITGKQCTRLSILYCTASVSKVLIRMKNTSGLNIKLST
ncbi:MAG: hypothetical protein ACXVHW_01055 [Methanobacterium sp.]